MLHYFRTREDQYLLMCIFIQTNFYGVLLQAKVSAVVGLIFAGYLPLASQSPYPIIVYSVANYRLHLILFWENM